MDPKKEMRSRERRRLNKGKEKKRGPIQVGKGQGSSFQEKRRGSRDKIRGNGQGAGCQLMTLFPDQVSMEATVWGRLPCPLPFSLAPCLL